eukprot:492816_1
MELIAEAYQSSDDENESNSNRTNQNECKSIMLAPNIDTSTSMQMGKYHDINTKEIHHNPTADVLFGPIEGPLRPHSKSRQEEFKPPQTTLCGYVDIDNVDGMCFTEQYHTYQSFGYAVDPTHNEQNKNKYIGNTENLMENKAMTIFNQSNQMMKHKKAQTKKRLRNDDPSDIEGYLGPWAPTYKTKEDQEKYEKDLAKRKQEWQLTETLRAKKRKLNKEDEEDEEETEETRRAKRERERKYTESIERSEFNGADDEMYDYQGR